MHPGLCDSVMSAHAEIRQLGMRIVNASGFAHPQVSCTAQPCTARLSAKVASTSAIGYFRGHSTLTLPISLLAPCAHVSMLPHLQVFSCPWSGRLGGHRQVAEEGAGRGVAADVAGSATPHAAVRAAMVVKHGPMVALVAGVPHATLL